MIEHGRMIFGQYSGMFRKFLKDVEVGVGWEKSLCKS